MRIYDKVALAIISDDRLLLCRPFAYDALIMPGGVREPNETDMECLQREIAEELGDVTFDARTAGYVGDAEDIAAGPTDAMVRIRLYRAKLDGTPTPCSEIRQLLWFGPTDDVETLSPVVRNKIIPMLVSQGLLSIAHLRSS
jgi:8-oxo-dGTP pyrophosphatase MutT (NUDIX family)